MLLRARLRDFQQDGRAAHIESQVFLSSDLNSFHLLSPIAAHQSRQLLALSRGAPSRFDTIRFIKRSQKDDGGGARTVQLPPAGIFFSQIKNRRRERGRR